MAFEEQERGKKDRAEKKKKKRKTEERFAKLVSPESKYFKYLHSNKLTLCGEWRKKWWNFQHKLNKTRGNVQRKYGGKFGERKFRTFKRLIKSVRSNPPSQALPHGAKKEKKEKKS